ncbi:MAG: aminopeptidase, partial [Synergistetes bacterium HGW-Synergistetes-2]
MTSAQRIEDYGIRIGRMKRGLRNTIADVPGVSVGHCTLADGPVQTGVTAVIPSPGNLFREKVMAACHVINGFGKSCGIVQIEEMGTLETPILLTNTFGVGAASEALVRSMLAANPDIGRETGTVNPAVFECNDG